MVETGGLEPPSGAVPRAGLLAVDACLVPYRVYRATGPTRRVRPSAVCSPATERAFGRAKREGRVEGRDGASSGSGSR
jgi:hypothetical protein